MVGERPGQGLANGAASGGRHVLAGGEYFSIVRTEPLHFVLAGELDICCVRDLTATLADAAGSAGIMHLDLAEVRFCDLAALRAILGLTQISDPQQGQARPVVLHRPPAPVLRMLELTGWGTLPGVTMDTTEILS